MYQLRRAPFLGPTFMVAGLLLALSACDRVADPETRRTLVAPDDAPLFHVLEPCDFVTGGGFIFPFGGQARANFGAGGGCKHGSPTWGHLNYVDRGDIPGADRSPLHVFRADVTAYWAEEDPVADPRDPKRIGTRYICGTARTNQAWGTVSFAVRVSDFGEPGTNDEFDIRLTELGTSNILYQTWTGTPTKLSGGNIQLHMPNPSTTGQFDGSNCPAHPGQGPQGSGG